MRKKLLEISQKIELVQVQPVYAIAAKAAAAEQAVRLSYDLLVELVDKVEALENDKN